MSSSQRPSENSVLFSLRELRRIEDDRVKKEQDAEALQRFDAKTGRYPTTWKELGPRYNQ